MVAVSRLARSALPANLAGKHGKGEWFTKLPAVDIIACAHLRLERAFRGFRPFLVAGSCVGSNGTGWHLSPSITRIRPMSSTKGEVLLHFLDVGDVLLLPLDTWRASVGVVPTSSVDMSVLCCVQRRVGVRWRLQQYVYMCRGIGRDLAYLPGGGLPAITKAGDPRGSRLLHWARPWSAVIPGEYPLGGISTA